MSPGYGERLRLNRLPRQFSTGAGRLARLVTEPGIFMDGSEIVARPIIFSAQMVRALLSGRKYQTRRILKPPAQRGRAQYPYGAAGDELWVREACCADVPDVVEQQAFGLIEGTGCVRYKADNHLAVARAPPSDWLVLRDYSVGPKGLRFVPCIHMPRWASRIRLRLTGVLTRPLTSISPEDCLAEGIQRIDGAAAGSPSWYGLVDLKNSWRRSPIEAFAWFWDHLNGAGAFKANPDVWVLEFDRVADA